MRTIAENYRTMHTDDKYKHHSEAYSRHVSLLINSTLRPSQIPHWLTCKWLLHKDTQCKKPYADAQKALWTLFMKVKREVIRDYLPVYREIAKEGTGSGTVWLEKLERLRQILYNIELKQGQNKKVFLLLC